MEYLKHIEKIIKGIKRINLKNGWAYEEIILSFLKIKKFPIILIPYPKERMIFRSRINENGFFSKIDEIAYPKEQYVSEFGRANKPRQSLFYGSDNRPTSYLEFVNKLSKEKTPGDIFSFTIGGWEVMQTLNLALILNPFEKSPTAYYQSYGVGFNEFVFQRTPPEYQKGTIRLFNFIAEEYGQMVYNKTQEYFLTCAYSNIIFSYPECDGIIYPSVPRGGEGFNVALKKDVVDEEKLILRIAGKDTFQTSLQKNGKHSFTQIDSKNAREIDYSLGMIYW